MAIGLVQIPPRGRTQQADLKVQCYEPTTMKYLGYSPALTPAEVSDVVCFSGLRSVGSDSFILVPFLPYIHLNQTPDYNFFNVFKIEDVFIYDL